MNGFVPLIAIAAAAGVAVAIQARLMGAMDRTVGSATSVFVTYGAGALVAAALWLARGAPASGLRRIEWSWWTAGAWGLVIVGGIGYAAPRLGLARTLVITVAAQLLTAALLEQSLDARRLAGLVLVAAGVWLTVK